MVCTHGKHLRTYANTSANTRPPVSEANPLKLILHSPRLDISTRKPQVAKEFDYQIHVNHRTSPEGIMDMLRYEQARVIGMGAACHLPQHVAPCTLWHLRAPMPPTVARWASFGIATLA